MRGTAFWLNQSCAKMTSRRVFTQPRPIAAVGDPVFLRCGIPIRSTRPRSAGSDVGTIEAKRLGGLHIEHGLVFRSNFARSSPAISLAKA
jgi:hypothetical protein